MGEQSDEVSCRRCGHVMEAGYATALGLIGSNPLSGSPRLVFVVPGQPTSTNPVKAFRQGLESERSSEAYLLRGHRCPKCGAVELSAVDKAS
jgi:hypothetical protein